MPEHRCIVRNRICNRFSFSFLLFIPKVCMNWEYWIRCTHFGVYLPSWPRLDFLTVILPLLPNFWLVACMIFSSVLVFESLSPPICWLFRRFFDLFLFASSVHTFMTNVKWKLEWMFRTDAKVQKWATQNMQNENKPILIELTWYFWWCFFFHIFTHNTFFDCFIFTFSW